MTAYLVQLSTNQEVNRHFCGICRALLNLMRSVACVGTPSFNSTLLDKHCMPLAPGFSKLGDNFISCFED